MGAEQILDEFEGHAQRRTRHTARFKILMPRGELLADGHRVDIGGAADVESELGRGSAFTVLLPRHGRASQTSPAVEELPRGAAQTILLVADGTALLRRRPNVREAERDLGAATARVGCIHLRRTTRAISDTKRLMAERG
jgi:hypothetical protein